jgi:hypothetical protein
VKRESGEIHAEEFLEMRGRNIIGSWPKTWIIGNKNESRGLRGNPMGNFKLLNS